MANLKKQKREIYFTKSLAFFLEKYIAETLEQFATTESKVVIEAVVCKDSGKTINDKYWIFIDEHIKPLINIENGSADVEKFVDIYKILSATEYAVMATKPLLITKNGQRINNKEDKDYLIIENLVNAHFAFYCAHNLLINWDGYKEVFSDEELNTALLDFKEPHRDMNDAMALKEEHVAIIAFSNNNASLPVFINATWWRLYCLCTTIIRRNTLHATNFLPKD